MTTTILHEELTPIFASQPGSDGGNPVVVDLGARILSGTIESENFFVSGTPANDDYWAWTVELADVSAVPDVPGVFRKIVERQIPFDAGFGAPVFSEVITNRIWPAWLTVFPSPSSDPVYARYLRAGLIVIKGPGISPPPSLNVKLTLFDGEDVIVQMPVPVSGANVYLSTADALIRAAELCLTSPAQLSPEKRDSTWILATRRIELEVAKRCQPRGSSLLIPDDQTILWPRDNAYSAIGPLIDSWLDSWVDGILYYWEEWAEAILLGEDPAEPAEDRGLTVVEVAAEGAKWREEWSKTAGSDADFFTGRERIWASLAESFPYGGAI